MKWSKETERLVNNNSESDKGEAGPPTRPEKWGGGKLYHEYMNLPQHRGLIKAQNGGLIK